MSICFGPKIDQNLNFGHFFVKKTLILEESAQALGGVSDVPARSLFKNEKLTVWPFRQYVLAN